MRPNVLLSVALLGLMAMAPPKPKAARNLSINAQGASACPATGDCRLILSWARPVTYQAGADTGRVTWNRTSPSSAQLFSRIAKGTADTVMITRPAAGATTSGTVTLCYSRAGWTGAACNAPFPWSVTVPQTPPDTATGLKLSAILVTPPAASAIAGGAVQLCPVARWSDGSVTPVVAWPVACALVL